MLKVRCINDNWENLPDDSFVRKVLLVGDELPVKGREYIVKGHSFIRGKFGYELEDLDYRPYGVVGTFSVDRFEVVSSKFTPNHICEVTGLLAETKPYYIEIDLDPSLFRKENSDVA